MIAGLRAPGARTRLIATLVLLLTFAAGAAAGWGMARWSHEHSSHERDRRHAHFLDRIDLTRAQRARIDSIFARRHAEVSTFWKGPGQQLRRIVDSTRAEIRAVLTPAQRREFDRMDRVRMKFRGEPDGKR